MKWLILDSLERSVNILFLFLVFGCVSIISDEDDVIVTQILIIQVSNLSEVFILNHLFSCLYYPLLQVLAPETTYLQQI